MQAVRLPINAKPWTRGRMPLAYRLIFLVVAATIGTALADAAPTPLAAGGATTPTPSPAGAPSRNLGTSALVVDDAGAQTLLGVPVQTSKGEDLGHVVDVVVDRKGVLMAAIVDFGGFLGVGSRKIAVDWRILHFPATGAMGKLIADLPLDQLRNAPVFKVGEPIVIMGAPAAPALSQTAPPSTPSPPAPKP